MIDLYRKLTTSVGRSQAPQPDELPDIGNRDDRLSGWRQEDTRQLFDGFPIVDGDIVVDVGCGDGANGHFCARHGAHVVMIDIDPAKVANAKWRCRDLPADSFEAILSDSNPIPLPDGFVTKIVSSEVIEHVDDPVQFLEELVRIGRRGAQYLLSVPDPVCEHLAKQVAHPSAFQKPNHVRIIEREEFAQMVGAAGLVIERRHSVGFYDALRSLFFWADYVDPKTNRTPLLDGWSRTWDQLLDTKHGPQIKVLLESVLPKSQVIVARKP